MAHLLLKEMGRAAFKDMHMTIVINKKWLRELWAPVGGHDDWDDSPWKNSDILDEVVLQRLIEDE